MSSVEDVKKKYAEQLLRYAGVTGVSTNHDRAIIVYVENLTPELLRFIPQSLEGVPVKIVSTGGKFQLLSGTFSASLPPSAGQAPSPAEHLLNIPVVSEYQNRLLRYRPVPGGVSIGSVYITAGTLGTAALDLSDNTLVGLSNNHILGPVYPGLEQGVEGETPILQPGVYDGGKDPADRIGLLKRIVPVVSQEVGENKVDAAIFASDFLEDRIAEIGSPKPSIDSAVNMNVVKSGRSSAVTYGKVIDTTATINVQANSGIAVFSDVVLTEPAILSPGDSGSWVGSQDTWQTVGLGFAGTSTISAYCKAKNVEELLNIQIMSPTALPTINIPEPLRTLGLLGGIALGALGLVRYTGRK